MELSVFSDHQFSLRRRECHSSIFTTKMVNDKTRLCPKSPRHGVKGVGILLLFSPLLLKLLQMNSFMSNFLDLAQVMYHSEGICIEVMLHSTNITRNVKYITRNTSVRHSNRM